MITSRRELGIKRHVHEHVFNLGPLTLRSTLRLFSRLSPFISSGSERKKLLELLVNPEFANATILSKGVDFKSLNILTALGGGFPRHVVSKSYSMTKEEFADLCSL